MSEEIEDEMSADALRQLDDHLHELVQMVGMRLLRRHVPLHDVLQRVIESTDSRGRGGASAYIYGSIGTGKTQQLAEAGRKIITLAARRGKCSNPVIYAPVPDVIAEMRESGGERYLNVPWLLLDEVGFGVEDVDFHHLLRLIDFRYRHELPIIFASLHKLQDLAMGQCIGWDDRIASRIVEMCGISSIPAPDNYIALKEQHRLRALVKK